ncbi:uncharacterized protein LOC132204662 [Neocloeon triangulifer]|uniref:uncharacterized protein LOC132204662 n=1 Tax=Neocloeon triangulifer TaxID=2078957 RepID=UPI00286F1A77|nr:uncharacterized protein LOC132204662 [Neocloeon triangulifer]
MKKKPGPKGLAKSMEFILSSDEDVFKSPPTKRQPLQSTANLGSGQTGAAAKRKTTPIFPGASQVRTAPKLISIPAKAPTAMAQPNVPRQPRDGGGENRGEAACGPSAQDVNHPPVAVVTAPGYPVAEVYDPKAEASCPSVTLANVAIVGDKLAKHKRLLMELPQQFTKTLETNKQNLKSLMLHTRKQASEGKESSEKKLLLLDDADKKFTDELEIKKDLVCRLNKDLEQKHRKIQEVEETITRKNESIAAWKLQVQRDTALVEKLKSEGASLEKLQTEGERRKKVLEEGLGENHQERENLKKKNVEFKTILNELQTKFDLQCADATREAEAAKKAAEDTLKSNITLLETKLKEMEDELEKQRKLEEEEKARKQLEEEEKKKAAMAEEEAEKEAARRKEDSESAAFLVAVEQEELEELARRAKGAVDLTFLLEEGEMVSFVGTEDIQQQQQQQESQQQESQQQEQISSSLDLDNLVTSTLEDMETDQAGAEVASCPPQTSEVVPPLSDSSDEEEAEQPPCKKTKTGSPSLSSCSSCSSSDSSDGEQEPRGMEKEQIGEEGVAGAAASVEPMGSEMAAEEKSEASAEPSVESSPEIGPSGESSSDGETEPERSVSKKRRRRRQQKNKSDASSNSSSSDSDTAGSPVKKKKRSITSEQVFSQVPVEHKDFNAHLPRDRPTMPTDFQYSSTFSKNQEEQLHSAKKQAKDARLPFTALINYERKWKKNDQDLREALKAVTRQNIPNAVELPELPSHYLEYIHYVTVAQYRSRLSAEMQELASAYDVVIDGQLKFDSTLEKMLKAIRKKLKKTADQQVVERELASNETIERFLVPKNKTKQNNKKDKVMGQIGAGKLPSKANDSASVDTRQAAPPPAPPDTAAAASQQTVQPRDSSAENEQARDVEERQRVRAKVREQTKKARLEQLDELDNPEKGEYFEITARSDAKDEKFETLTTIAQFKVSESARDAPMGDILAIRDVILHIIKDVSDDSWIGITLSTRAQPKEAGIPLMRKNQFEPNLIFNSISGISQSRDEFTIDDSFKIIAVIVNDLGARGRRFLGNLDISAKSSSIPAKNDQNNKLDKLLTKSDLIELGSCKDSCVYFAALVGKIHADRVAANEKGESNEWRQAKAQNSKAFTQKVFELIRDVGLPFKNGSGHRNLQKIQEIFGREYKIIAFAGVTLESRIFGSDYVDGDENRKKIFLYMDKEKHFHALLSAKAFFDKKHFCDFCEKPVDNLFHREYFETRQDQTISVNDKVKYKHMANLVHVSNRCVNCLDDHEGEDNCYWCGKREKSFDNFDQPDKSVVGEFLNYMNDKCKSRKSFNRHQGIVLQFNAASFDNHLVLSHVMNDENWIVKDIIMSGLRILQMRIKNKESGVSLKWLDMVNFTPAKLADLPKAFKIENVVKGHFPHYANKPEYYNYDEGRLPPAETFGPDCMTTGAREEFLKWYEETNKELAESGSTWNFRENIKHYCKNDVRILRIAALKFREMIRLFRIEPFLESLTMASLTHEIYKRNHYLNGAIGILPKNDSYRGSQSKEGQKYLTYVEKFMGIKNLQHAGNGKEKVIGGAPVDGFDPDTGTIYQFHGCWFHCCVDCFPNATSSPRGTGIEVRSKTYARTKFLRDQGYTVVEMYECKWKEKMKSEAETYLKLCTDPIVEMGYLRARNALFGGHCSAFRLQCLPREDEEIQYLDFTSMYSFVNKYGKYPIGHPKVYTKDFPDIKDVNGLVYCEMDPPGNLHHPVLPEKVDGKLLFHLCSLCARLKKFKYCPHNEEQRKLTGTWVSYEILLALKYQYKIRRIFEIWDYSEIIQYMTGPDGFGSNGLFGEFVNCFLKIKAEASGWPRENMTQEEKDAYVEEFWQIEGIRLDPNKIERNEVMRYIAKLILNSLWGRFAMRTDMTKTAILDERSELLRLLSSPNVEVQSLLTNLGEKMIATYKDEASQPKGINVVVAAFTTAQARILLYRLLDLGGHRVLYTDTDSVIVVQKKGEPIFKTGNGLGQLTNEVPNQVISEYLAVAPKNYGLALQNTDGSKDAIRKIKGITLRHNCLEQTSLATLRRLIHGELEEVEINIYKKIERTLGFQLVSSDTSKKIKLNYDKRFREEGVVDFSSPHGLKENWPPVIPDESIDVHMWSIHEYAA